MRVGVTLLPEHAWEQDRHRWKRAEQYGFDHAWTFDHLAWRSLADSAWYATIPTLVAAALETSALRLGTWVTTPNFRHPVPLAKELMTLDRMSSGRLNIGLGAGAQGWDASVLGQPALTPAQASSRFSEFVTVLDLLLTQPRTTWQGHSRPGPAATTAVHRRRQRPEGNPPRRRPGRGLGHHGHGRPGR
jgi:alkanesulfonate monooxygenase SsuD/methylene tetrahydromethanopterin reductase-like flavin-dependent oxidoreductase (luciferase family)